MTTSAEAVDALPARRMLLVHAHPDDETIGTGATMAKYAAEGAHVALVTCTRGEQGEIIPADLGHLAADQQDALGDHRVGELAAAMAALGVRDHRFLDELPLPGTQTARAVRYRDSGMTYGPDGVIALPDDARDNAFAKADLDEAASRLAWLIRRVRPQVVATYDPDGGYGHPDHVQAHRVAMRGVELARSDEDGGVAGWAVSKVYWTGIPESAIRAAIASIPEGVDSPFKDWDVDRLPSMVMPDAEVTARIDGTAYAGLKADAMRAHATQIAVDGAFFALSNAIGQPMIATEYFKLVQGEPGGPRDGDGRESDLFGGVA